MLRAAHASTRRDQPFYIIMRIGLYYDNRAILWMVNSQLSLRPPHPSRYAVLPSPRSRGEGWGEGQLPTNSDLSSLISDSGRSSRPISEFRASAVTRINSS